MLPVKVCPPTMRMRSMLSPPERRRNAGHRHCGPGTRDHLRDELRRRRGTPDDALSFHQTVADSSRTPFGIPGRRRLLAAGSPAAPSARPPSAALRARSCAFLRRRLSRSAWARRAFFSSSPFVTSAASPRPAPPHTRRQRERQRAATNFRNAPDCHERRRMQIADAWTTSVSSAKPSMPSRRSGATASLPTSNVSWASFRGHCAIRARHEARRDLVLQRLPRHGPEPRRNRSHGGNCARMGAGQAEHATFRARTTRSSGWKRNSRTCMARKRRWFSPPATFRTPRASQRSPG